MRKLIIGALLLLIGFSSSGQEQIKSVVLPENAAAAVHREVNRDFGKQGWSPAKDDIVALEAHLRQIEALEPENWSARIRIQHPEQYFRQYVGVIRAGQKLVYINAFCYDPPSDWRDRLYVVMDGGTCFWQALYDPTTKAFSHLTINGAA